MRADCSRCGRIVKDIKCIDDFKKRGLKVRRNFPFGRKSRGRTVVSCDCGGVMNETIQNKE